MESITSRTNPLILDIIKLRESKHRRSSGMFAFEGKKLLTEALAKKVDLEYIFYTEQAKDFCISAVQKHGQKCSCIKVSSSVYEKLSIEKSPEGIFCVARGLDKLHKFATIYNVCSEEQANTRLMLSSIRDPGNLGTIIRTGLAFGVGEFILSSDCADIYNPKVIRATMGALFSARITVVEDIPSSIKALQQNECHVYATALSEKAENLKSLTLPTQVCFIIGNEANGLSADVISVADKCVYIPMATGVESLNAAAAATVLMWEAFRELNG